MLKSILVSLFTLVFSTLVFAQSSTLPKELEDAVKAKCLQGCAVLSAEEMVELNAAVEQLAKEAFQKGRAYEKGSCRKLGNET